MAGVGSRTTPELLIVGLGGCLRLIVYARNHDFCFDEQSLWGNIAGMPIYEFSSELIGRSARPVRLHDRSSERLSLCSAYSGRSAG